MTASSDDANSPLDSQAHEQRIALRAYHLWEQEGRPDGRAEEYWERARILTGIADSAGAGQLPNPQTHPPRVTTAGTPIEEASLQENLGEFPGRQADQGEKPQAPAPHRRAGAKSRNG